VLLGTLIFGLALACFLHAPAVVGHLSTLAFAGVLVAYVLLFRFAFGVGSRDEPLPIVPFLAGWLLATVLLHALYLGLVRPTLTTDFRGMWTFAQIFAASEVLPTPQQYSAQRALPILMPLVSIFGTSPWVYKIGNVVLVVLASLVYYDLLRRWFGHCVAQAFLLLLVGIPEVYFACATTSHDVSGLFFLSCAFWLASSVYRQVSALDDPSGRTAWLVAGATSLALGILLTFLQVQRNVSTFFLLAATAVLLAEAWAGLVGRVPLSWISCARRSLLRLLLVVAIPYALMAGSLGILSERGVLLSATWQEEFAAKNFASFANSFSPGTVTSDRYFRKDFLELLSHEEVVDLGRSIFLSDTYYDAPRQRPANYLLRASRLFNLGSQHHHYYPALEEDSPLSLEQVREPLDSINEIVLVLFGLAGVVALFIVLFLKPPALITLLPLTYLAGLAAGLLLFGENQPRYLFAIWLILPGTIGLAFSHGSRRIGSEIDGVRLAKRLVAGPLLLGLFITVGWIGVRAFYSEADGRIIAGWERVSSNTALSNGALAEHFQRMQLGTRTAAATRAFGSLVTTLQLPRAAKAGDYLEVSSRLCRDGSARSVLAFHLFWKGVPQASDGAFEFSVNIDGRPVYERSITSVSSLGPVRIKRAMGAKDCVRLGLRVNANGETDRVGPTRASRVHVYFARLVE